MYSPHPSENLSKSAGLPEDRERLLHSAVLKVGAEVVSGSLRRDRVVVKNAATGDLIGVSRDERAILQAFGAGATVPDVLAKLIMKGKSPPLREFYELVLKALEKGILLEESAGEPPRKRAVDFRFALPAVPAALLIAAAFGIFLYALAAADFRDSRAFGVFLSLAFATDFVLPRSGYDYLAGYFAVSVALGLGNLLAAGLLRASEAEVYDPAWRWRSPVPHFRFNLQDVRMAGGKAEVLAGLLRLGPLVALFALAAFQAPFLSLVLLLGVMWQTLPLRAYPVSQVLSGLTGRIPLDTHRDPLFERSRRTWGALRRRLGFENGKYLAILLLAWAFWAGSVVYLSFLLAPGLLAEEIPALLSATFLLPALAVAAVLPAGLAARAGVRNARDAIRRYRRKRARIREKEAELAPYGFSNPPPEEKVLAMLGESIVFGEIKSDDRKAIAKKLRPHFISARETMVSADSAHDRMYIVFKGKFEAMRELPSGRSLRLARLGHGDVFGNVPLWDEAPRLRIIRSLTRGIVYSLSREDFSKIVISAASHTAIKDAVKASFLSRIPFFREWPRETIRDFARTGSFVVCPAGKYVVREGQPNLFFYIVYDGVSERIVNGRRRTRLGIGEFFGEISLMRNVSATADVFAREGSRYLVFGRKDFVRFVCRHPEAALAFEKACSQRLGEPVFPVQSRRKGG